MPRSIRIVFAVVTTSASLLACNNATSTKPTLVLAPPSLTLLICQEGLVSASVSTQTASAVVFQSADPTVATVSASGTVRGVKSGVTRVRAWLAEDATVRDSSDVTVTTPGPCPRVIPAAPGS